MDDPSFALALALGAPLAGAAFVTLPVVTARARVVGVATILTVALAGLGVAALLVARPVIGVAGRHSLSLGVLDPVRPVAGIAWTLLPVALGVLFVAIAMRRRRPALVGLALTALALAVAGAVVGWPGGSAASARGMVADGPTDGSLILDPLAATLVLVVVGVGGLIVVYAVGYEPGHLAHRGLPARRTAPFLAWLLLFLAAMQLLVLADDLRLLTVGWEVTTLCSFVLIRFDGDEPAKVAADRALLYNLGGGAALALALVAAGPDARLSSILGAAGGARGPGIAWLPICLACAIAAAAVKSALVPFHPWLLGAMVAAAPVSALLHASTMVNAGSYLMFRLSPAIAADGLLGPALAGLGGVTFAWTALLALRDRDLKRILALSTISTLGLMAAAAGLGSPAALAAGVTLLVFHAAAKALAFLAVGMIEQVGGTRDLEQLVGIARRRPWLAAPLLVAAAALALPPFGTAVAKWAVLELGVRDVVLSVLLAAGATAGVALWTVVTARLIVRRPGRLLPVEAAGRVPRSSAAAIVALAVVSIGGVLLAAPVTSLLGDPAAEVAFGTSPGLAAGWSILLPGGGFAVPIIAALLLVAVAAAVIVARRTARVAPPPYLSGATLDRRGAVLTAFHGPRGAAVNARSGGFYWGAAAGPVPSSASRGLEAATVAMVIGWAAVALVVGAGLASALLASGRVGT